MAKLDVGKTVGNVGEFLREQRREAELSLRQLAEQAGVSNPYLSQIERGLRRPSAEVLQQLAKALRISAETLYAHAGFLDATPADQRSVRDAVLADAGLTDRQKRVLLDIYISFRRENDAADGPPVDESPLGESTSDTSPQKETTPHDYA